MSSPEDETSEKESEVDREGYCKHGVYVGGIGIDWMCGRCEDGE